MPVEKINTLVVGAGQAGIATSEHLSNHNIPHLVLEKYRIAERWRTGRWDSLAMNGPAWHDRFPNLEFENFLPDDFPDKESVADYFVAYSEKISAPIRTGVEVTHAIKIDGQTAYRVKTSQGVIEAQNIVAATGPFHKPIIPPVVPKGEPIHQIHSDGYKNPEQLPEGAVLVVGAGSSGAQIADELLRTGKDVYLSVGPHDRPPRSYRGRDFVWWLGVLGLWDNTMMTPGREHVTIAVSGAYGGKTINFRKFAERGMKLVGMTQSYKAGVMKFAPDLKDNVEQGDANYLSVLNEADDFITANGLDLPFEENAKIIGSDPECMTDPILELDLAKASINSIIWATGFVLDYSWLKADIFDDIGKPIHQRGVAKQAGIYFVGLPWQSRRGSSFIWGVWHDAKYVADQIAKQQMYFDHHATSATVNHSE